MRVRVWGCRGSLAAPGPATVRYGGNTSCLEVELEEGRLIFDAGSGIRLLGERLCDVGADRRPIHILLSHLHLDHLQGLAFFAPLWRPECELHVWGPQSPTQSLEERVATYLSPPLFPVHLSDVPSSTQFHDAPDDPWELEGALVSAIPVSHNGPTLGYRVEHDGQSVAYLPDHEPSLGIQLETLDPAWVSGYGVAAGVDVLFHDSQYSEDEYPNHVGWGHSSIDHVIAFARKVGVRQLVLFHHDPGHSDDDLERLRARALELWGDLPNAPVLAADGMDLDVASLAAAL